MFYWISFKFSFVYQIGWPNELGTRLENQGSWVWVTVWARIFHFVILGFHSLQPELAMQMKSTVTYSELIPCFGKRFARKNGCRFQWYITFHVSFKYNKQIRRIVVPAGNNFDLEVGQRSRSWSQLKGLDTRIMHTQYQCSIINTSKDMSQVKFCDRQTTEGQTDEWVLMSPAFAKGGGQLLHYI